MKKGLTLIDTQNILMLGTLWHPIYKAGSTTSFSSEDAFPSISWSAKKLKFSLMIVIVKRMKTMFILQDKYWLVMLSRTKQIKLIMI